MDQNTEDGRKVKFIYQNCRQAGHLSPRRLRENEVVYSVLLTKARSPLSREDADKDQSISKSELSPEK